MDSVKRARQLALHMLSTEALGPAQSAIKAWEPFITDEEEDDEDESIG